MLAKYVLVIALHAGYTGSVTTIELTQQPNEMVIELGERCRKAAETINKKTIKEGKVGQRTYDAFCVRIQ